MSIPEGWSGTNSSGEHYFLAPSLRIFRHSINVAYPNRSYVSDGWIGDAAHAARVSDHNPCWSCAAPYRGIVRAIDVTNDPAIPEIRERILDSAIGHPAVWYVISNGKIYSRTHGWKANDYTGANQHEHHVHISLNHDVASYNNTSLILKSKVQDIMSTLDADDIKAIGAEVYRQNSAYAKAFWVASTGTGTLIRRDIAAIKAAIDPAKFAAAIAAKLPAASSTDTAAIEAAVRAVFADAAS